jgi:pilus assembly protein CpaC
MRLFLACLLSLFTLASLAPAHAWNEVRTEETHGVLKLEQSRSTVVQADVPFTKIALADPEIAEAMPTSNQLFLIRARKPGTTTILLYDGKGDVVEFIELEVTIAIAALQRDLKTLLPNEEIIVHPILDGIFLEGVVSTDAAAARAMQIAERHVPGGVTNGLTTLQAEQVMLEVRFIEASRDQLKDIGFRVGYSENGDSFNSGNGLVGGATGAATAIFRGVAGENIDIRLDALESQGAIQTLARPNLVALSGDTASFLAGGEFPIPINGGDGEVTITYRQFGVSLAFTPTVVGGDLVNLNVRPEVSQIDERNGVSSGGVSVPALTVRRVDTTVELRDGQAFAIAGLLQDRTSEQAVNTPILSSIPVLGALFSSKRYQREETELVIIVTPRLVKPVASPDAIRTPLDDLETPNEGEFFLGNKLSFAPHNQWRTFG